MDYSLPGFSVLEILQTRILEWIAIPLFRGIFPTQGSNTGLNVIKRCLLLGRKAMKNLDSVLKQWHSFAEKRSYSQRYGFSSSHVRMWKLDYKEGWMRKNWRFWIVLLEKTLESPLDSKEIKPVSPKGNHPWIFIGRTETEAPILWPSVGKSQLIGKTPDAEKEWKQKEKGATDDEMAGWHCQLSAHEFEQTWGGCGGQMSLACACCSPSDHKELGLTWWPNQVGQSGF